MTGKEIFNRLPQRIKYRLEELSNYNLDYDKKRDRALQITGFVDCLFSIGYLDFEERTFLIDYLVEKLNCKSWFAGEDKVA